MLQNVKVAIRATKNGLDVPEVNFVWESLSEKELLHLEKRLNNVMVKMQEAGEEGTKTAGDETRGKLEFEFAAWNDRGFEIAWQGNRWTGMRGAEMDFMIGLLRGELEKLEDGVKGKGKNKKKK